MQIEILDREASSQKTATQGPICQEKKSCQVMAFVIPFIVITGKAMLCGHFSTYISMTLGVLAGVSSFLGYRVVKGMLASFRAKKQQSPG